MGGAGGRGVGRGGGRGGCGTANVMEGVRGVVGEDVAGIGREV